MYVSMTNYKTYFMYIHERRKFGMKMKTCMCFGTNLLVLGCFIVSVTIFLPISEVAVLGLAFPNSF